MKETKKFFDTNRLNKGYNKSLVYKQSDTGANNGNQYKHVLPPLSIMAEYEEMHPGTIKKVLDLAQKEQEHRHAMELLALTNHEKAVKIGRQSAIILVGIIAFAAVIMAFDGHYMIASIFSLAGFGLIGVASIFQSRKMNVGKVFHKTFDPKYKNSNYKDKKHRRL